MKNRKAELDVDFIGEQGRIVTQEEQQAISDFIKANKQVRDASVRRKAAKRKAQPAKMVG